MQAFSSSKKEPADRSPREDILLVQTLSPEASCRAATAQPKGPHNVAHPSFSALPAKPAPDTARHEPVDGREHFSGSGAMAVVASPAAKDEVQFVELAPKRHQVRIGLGEDLYLVAQISGFCFGNLDTGKISVSLESLRLYSGARVTCAAYATGER
jgi:hypothetical protein